ncbi:tetratricopeptide repeat protein [Nodosilinea sp. LEGE 06152]|uniref:tetratricopeptide repeat protein n=1 Tax=Nodosilinea sp. LEGE 06152 TaxID=2777966 RepID=UPI001882604D|nr:tetratricopeptide repeat protein [Nodosilinea sp. LEGE 06152]MBE9157945.1 tetratricopeptide repeat protein [Nodosilinea sp. LEGE 06152]
MTSSRFAIAYLTQSRPVILMQAFPTVQTIEPRYQLSWLRSVPALLETGKAQSALGHLYCQLGEWDRAAGAYLRSLNAFSHAEDAVALGRTLTHLSVVFAQRQQYRWAYDYAAQAVQHLHNTADNAGYAAALHTLGMGHYYRRRYRLALKTLEKALALRHELGDELGEAITLGCMGRVYAARGEHWCALSCYEAALDGYRQHQTLLEGNGYEIMIRRRIARLANCAGHTDLAIAHFEAALLLCQKCDRALAAEILIDLANLHEGLQQNKVALRYHQQARQLQQAAKPKASANNVPAPIALQPTEEGYY